jgi:hypothetical protein
MEYILSGMHVGTQKATCLRFKKTRKSCQQYRKETDLEVNWMKLYKKLDVHTLDRGNRTGML